MGVATAKPKKRTADETHASERLARLAEHLHISMNALSVLLDVDRSVLRRTSAGERGLTAKSVLVTRAAAKIGLRPDYWFNKPFKAPEGCIDESLKEADAAPPNDAAIIGQFAQRSGCPAGMVLELLGTRAPLGAGGPWWVSRFVELALKHGVDLGPTSS